MFIKHLAHSLFYLGHGPVSTSCNEQKFPFVFCCGFVRVCTCLGVAGSAACVFYPFDFSSGFTMLTQLGLNLHFQLYLIPNIIRICLKTLVKHFLSYTFF